jgi:hypothetical protein
MRSVPRERVSMIFLLLCVYSQAIPPLSRAYSLLRKGVYRAIA